MNSIKRFLDNTVVVFVLVILAIACIVAATFINIDIDSKQSAIQATENGLHVDVSSNETATETVTLSKKLSKESHEQELNTLLSNLESLSNQNSAVTAIIDRYIEVRYNYTDKPDKEYILEELSGITRKFFLGQVDNSLNYVTESSKAKIIKRYAPVTNIDAIQTGDSINTFVYIVNINGENKAIEYTVFREYGQWLIYSEKELGPVNNEDLQTKELLTPDVVKSTEADSTEGQTESALETQTKGVK